MKKTLSIEKLSELFQIRRAGDRFIAYTTTIGYATKTSKKNMGTPQHHNRVVADLLFLTIENPETITADLQREFQQRASNQSLFILLQSTQARQPDHAGEKDDYLWVELEPQESDQEYSYEAIEGMHLYQQ